MFNIKINPYAGVYKRAVELFESGYYNEAFAKLKVVIQNDLDNYKANFYIAECYFHGFGTEKKYDLAFDNYSIAASKQHLEAIYKVGYCYEFSLGTNKDDAQMISRYTQAAKSGHKLAQYRLGLCYKNGRGVEQNISVAATYFLNSAKGGVVEAQREGGICFEQLNQPTASATLFLAAAEHNDPYSCYKIGSFYETGYGCEKKYELAMHFYLTAATLGNEDAILVIANKYKKGIGLEKSITTALSWWNKIVDSNPIAQIEVAICYLKGTGVNQDRKKGISLLHKSANQKNPEACLLLAKVYEQDENEDVKKEYVKWLLKAAEYESLTAMYLLGEYHENKANIKECYRWYSIAANNGYEPAINAIKKYKKTIFGNIKYKN